MATAAASTNPNARYGSAPLVVGRFPPPSGEAGTCTVGDRSPGSVEVASVEGASLGVSLGRSDGASLGAAEGDSLGVS
jgi:hypothetical protein